MQDQHNILKLENGVHLIQRKINLSELVHCGIMINAGSRDENEINNGIAHFIEHSVFKGTSKRKSHQILTRIENVGGELNAYTTREKTCYYVSCLKQYADRAIDIVSDIVFEATFPEKEIAKEKKVILEEIEMYDDSPEESIYDDFYSLAYAGHPLGYNILGTKETVNNISRDTILDFRKKFYTTDRIVLSMVGDIPYEKGQRLAEKFLKDVPPTKYELSRSPATNYTPFEKTYEKDFAQTHCMMGNIAYSKHDQKRFGLSLINNILGGSGMSARLNMAVREKHGLTYHISSNYSSYQDTGVFSVYFATDKKNLSKARGLIAKELKKMREVKLSTRQLHQAKVQFLGHIAMIDENQSIHMQSQARSILDYDKLFTFRDFLKKVDEVTAEEILEISNEIFDPEKWSTLVYENEEDSKK